MEGPRPPALGEFPEVLDFLNHNLRPQAQWSIGLEYPTALNTRNLNQMRIIKSEGKIAAHALVHTHLNKSPAGIFKVAAIGSVVTDPHHRHQGLSTQVVNACLDIAQKQGCDFAILWTQLYDFYRKLGFELGGIEQAFIIEKNISTAHSNPSTHSNHLKILNTLKVDPAALLKVYSRHTLGATRTTEDFRRYLNIPNTQLYTAWDENNNLKAYAVEGKGEDLIGYIHEWGGTVSSLMPLLAHIRQEKNGPITLICSAQAQNLARQLKDQGALAHQGFLGMFRLLNQQNLCFKIRRYARQLGFSQWVFEYREGTYYLGSPQKMFQTTSEQDIIKLIFGPLTASEINGFDTETAHLIQKVLPIPFWIWGWDSI